jgi:hypothetical protein
MAEVLSYLGKGTTASDIDIGRLQTIKTASEMLLRRYLGCGITQATYTHYLPKGHPFDRFPTSRRISEAGAATERYWLGPDIVLPEYPLRSITSINEDRDGRFDQASGAFDSTTLLTEGGGYYWPVDASGFSRWATVIRIDTLWPANPGSIKVVYTAGWTSDELHGLVTDSTLDASPLRMATLKIIAESWTDKLQAETSTSGGGAGPLKQESFDGYSVTYDTEQGGTRVYIPLDVQVSLNSYKRLPSMLVT